MQDTADKKQEGPGHEYGIAPAAAHRHGKTVNDDVQGNNKAHEPQAPVRQCLAKRDEQRVRTAPPAPEELRHHCRSYRQHDANLKTVHHEAGKHEGTVAICWIAEDADPHVHGISRIDGIIGQQAQALEQTLADRNRIGAADFLRGTQRRITEHVIRRIHHDEDVTAESRLDILVEILRNA